MAREMKNSGVKWIGEIPKDWEVKKVKYLTRKPLQYGANESGVEYDESLPRYIRITDISMDNKLKDDGKLSLDFGKAKPYILEDEDLLFARSGASVGKTFLYKKEYGVSAFAGYLIKASFDKSKVSPIYFYYNTLSSSYESWKQQAFTQATIQNIGADKYNTLLVPFPPLPEQQAIADFLDAKCAEIDGLLADLEAEVKTLSEYKKSIISEVTTQGLNQNVKKKQSGIDWVGNIPAHWQVVPFRSYVVERAEKNFGGRNKNLLALSFALGVTRYADKKYNMDRVKEDFSGYQIVHEKDLVLSPNDIIKGSIYVSEYKGCISPMYRVFSNYDPETYNLYYLSYHLRTKESGRKFFYIARGLIGEILDNGKYVTRRMSVSQQDLLKFKVLLPPIEEQNEIVRYLDEKCASIEQSIADKQTQIEILKSYKASLIYEYVTGKKQVI